MSTHDPYHLAAAVVSDAGGKLVGRTRLQKVAYLSKLAGFGDEFEFEYRHYGPFSEELASAMEVACAFGLVQEEEIQAEWGGRYSIYKTKVEAPEDEDRAHFVSEAADIDAVLLELAATAAYLYTEEEIGNGVEGDPWEETKLRKPDKAADNRIAQAKKEYEKLLSLNTPKQLPRIV